MNVLFKTVALMLATNSALAFSTPEVRIKLIDKDNRPVAGMPIVMQTRQFDITKILTPHSNREYINSQRTVLTDANGIATVGNYSLLRTPKSIVMDLGYAVTCENRGIEHVIRNADVKFKIQTDGPKRGWICSLYADETSSDFTAGDLICKTDASAEDAIAAVHAAAQTDKDSGCVIEKNF